MTGRRLGVGECLVDGQRVRGDVIVADGKVSAIGALPAGPSGVAVPGLIDVQVNGFAGADFTSAELDGYRAAGQSIGRSGVTSFLATIPTAHPDRYRPALEIAAAAVAESGPGARPLGVHLEGPFLSPRRPGAHHPDWLRHPDIGLLERLLDAGPVTMMTLAPELDGSMELISRLCQRGVVVSLGHTETDGAIAAAAFDLGARCVTHLWNAQRPMTSREPAVGGTALARRDVFVGIIADLIHVAPDTLAVSVAAAGDRFVVVTDAVSFAGLADGQYRWGERVVTLADGAVRLEDGTLAGSACPMNVAIANLVRIGVPFEAAIAAATIAPARLLRRPDLGRLAPGSTADITVFADDFAVTEVLVDGRSIVQ